MRLMVRNAGLVYFRPLLTHCKLTNALSMIHFTFQFQCLEKNHLHLLCQWILSYKPSVSISVDLNRETIMGGRVPAGWPLGLETLNLRMSIMDAIRSTDPHPSLLATPSFSSLSSSDFDTESSISFFPDRSITLGSLIGIPSDRFGRHGSSCVHPEDGTQMGRSGMVAGRPKNYWGARRWKSFMGCMYLHSRVDSHPPSLGHFLKAEKKAGASVIGATRDEKVYLNIMYEESDAVLSNTNSLFLDPHTNHSSRMGSRRLPSLDLAMIQEESPSRLSNIDGLKDWSSAKGGLRVTGEHNRAQSLHSCLPYVSNILGKMSSSRASLCSGKISHL